MSKAEELAEKVSEDLINLIGLYLANIGKDKEANEKLYGELDKEWKKYVYTINNRQKGVKVSPQAFGLELKKKLEESLENKIK